MVQSSIQCGFSSGLYAYYNVHFSSLTVYSNRNLISCCICQWFFYLLGRNIAWKDEFSMKYWGHRFIAFYGSLSLSSLVFFDGVIVLIFSLDSSCVYFYFYLILYLDHFCSFHSILCSLPLFFLFNNCNSQKCHVQYNSVTEVPLIVNKKSEQS